MLTQRIAAARFARFHTASVERSYFRDAYRAPLTNPNASLANIFLAIFAHHPTWMKFALIARHRVASWFRLDVPSDAKVMSVSKKERYSVGDTIGVWPIFVLNDNELVAGRNNKHVDFRLSIFRELDGANASVVVSTVCVTHNRFGKVYLFFVKPFHKWGVKLIIKRAIRAGRF